MPGVLLIALIFTGLVALIFSPLAILFAWPFFAIIWLLVISTFFPWGPRKN